jgi:hypothetical protein
MDINGTITTVHDRPDCVAEAIRPDNLRSMATHATGDAVITTIRGESIRSVIASVDDYLMNLAIAEELCPETTAANSSRTGQNHSR